MARRRIARDHDPSDGGVPTPGARRARLATAGAALVVASALTVYAGWAAAGALVVLAGAAGIAVLGGALAFAWDDGLVLAPALLLVAYALSLADRGTALDWRAPFVAAGLLAVVEFGSWSLELRDGAEERPLARLPSLFVLLGAALGAGALVLAVGGIRTDAGLALWALGATAAIGLLALIGRPASP